MLWVKAFHIIFMIMWFAGLLYLPRLFVYHTMADDSVSHDRFVIMEKKLFAIMTLGALGTVLLGLWMLLAYAWQTYASVGWWLHVKLMLVVVLIGYHMACLKVIKIFREDSNTRSHVFFRWFNEFPVLILFGVIIMVVVRPF